MQHNYYLAWIFIYAVVVHGTEVVVRGKFVCIHRRNIIPIDVKLMEEDFSNVWLLRLFDMDDILAQTGVVYGERFMLTGQEKELGNIEPYVEAIHYCKGFREVVRIPLNATNEDYTVNIGAYILDPRPKTRRRHHITLRNF